MVYSTTFIYWSFQQKKHKKFLCHAKIFDDDDDEKQYFFWQRKMNTGKNCSLWKRVDTCLIALHIILSPFPSSSLSLSLYPSLLLVLSQFSFSFSTTIFHFISLYFPLFFFHSLSASISSYFYISFCLSFCTFILCRSLSLSYSFVRSINTFYFSVH